VLCALYCLTESVLEECARAKARDASSFWIHDYLERAGEFASIRNVDMLAENAERISSLLQVVDIRFKYKQRQSVQVKQMQ
jgi:hypothetical protein